MDPMDPNSQIAVATEVTPTTAVVEGENPTQATAPETDYKAEAERLKAENAQWEQRYKSLQGTRQVRVDGGEVLSRLEKLETEHRLTRRQLLKATEIDEVALNAELSAMDTEEQQAATLATFTKRSGRIVAHIGTQLEKANIPTEDPRVQEFIQRWGAASASNDLDAIETIRDEVDDFVADRREAAHKKEVADAKAEVARVRQEVNREENSVATGARAGLPGGTPPSLAALTKKDTRGMTLKELQEHGEALDRALGLQR